MPLNSFIHAHTGRGAAINTPGYIFVSEMLRHMRN
jgi:hypothetical protein